MHSLSNDERSKIHAVYLTMHDLPFSTQRKTSLLTTLMGGADWSWRVTGITVGALEAIAPTNYRYVKGKICRAHLVPRIDTARAMFERTRPLPLDEFFGLFWGNDETVIATKSENRTGSTLPPTLPIDYQLGLFKCNSLVGFRHGKRESEFLRGLHAAYRAGTIGVSNVVDRDIASREKSL